jgi:hypothetical protein
MLNAMGTGRVLRPLVVVAVAHTCARETVSVGILGNGIRDTFVHMDRRNEGRQDNR